MTHQTPAIPDRSHVATEQRNPRTMDLDALSVEDCLRRLNGEDAMVANAVRAAIDDIAVFVEALEARWRMGGRLVYLGAGTSGRLGVLDASECPPTFQTDPERIIGVIAGGDRALRQSSEGLEDDPHGAATELDALRINEHDTILGIAAGGTTPYVLGGLAIAHERGALTGLLTCSALRSPPGVDHVIVLETGPEPVTGSTRMKAGTATKMALNSITTTLMARTGKIHENLMVDLRASNAKLTDRAIRIIAESVGVDRETAAAALDAAGGSAKVAIVMLRASLSRNEAEQRLARCGGALRQALDGRKSP